MGILFCVIAAGMLEIVARSRLGESFMPPRTFGTGNPGFEAQVAAMDELKKRDKTIGCLFLGSSSVRNGIDPTVVSEIHRRETGYHIGCFNFGMPSVGSINAIPALVTILAERYEPDIVICGIGPASLGQSDRYGNERILLESSWVRYHLGEPSVDGWVKEHSWAAGRFLTFSTMILNPALAAQMVKVSDRGTTFGYAPMDDVMDVRRIEPIRVWRKRLERYRFSEEQLDCVRDLCERSEGPAIVILEFPYHRSITRAVMNPKQGYREALASIKRIATETGVAFWRTQGSVFLPDDCWKDPLHLNRRGAEILSEWTGRRLSNWKPEDPRRHRLPGDTEREKAL